jgi:alpha-tubulin suppressor-like RCC1 family protein
VPIAIDNIDNAIAVTSGEDFSCVLLSDHTARCVGDNTYGQLGTTADFGFPQRRDYPVAWEVVGPDGTGKLENIRSIVAGVHHTCAVVNERAYCWGFNRYATLGRGEAAGYEDSPIPAPVVGIGGTGQLMDVSAVSAGSGFSCAIVAGGEARCWGGHTFGELGAYVVSPETTEPSLWLSYDPAPVIVRGLGSTGPLTGATAISTGAHHTCAIVDTGVLCWGYNSHGQLGTAPEIYGLPFPGFESSPGVALSGVQAIAGGTDSTCVVVDGFEEVLCWGSGYGESDENGRTIPGTFSRIPGTRGVRTLADGEETMCGTHRDGSALCWASEFARYAMHDVPTP